MANKEEVWGPWISHDGKGCPVSEGTIVEVVCRNGFGLDAQVIGQASGAGQSSWDWQYYPEMNKILRYRIKRPKGLAILMEVLEKQPAPKKNKPVDA